MQDVDYQDLYTQIGQAMVTCAPQGWQRLELDAKAVVGTFAQGLWSLSGDQQERTRCDAPGVGSSRPLRTLREAMYEEGKGAWFSARVTVSADGAFTADFDYDNEAQWDIDLSDATYAADLQRYPRTPENTPPWLAERLRRAGAGQ